MFPTLIRTICKKYLPHNKWKQIALCLTRDLKEVYSFIKSQETKKQAKPNRKFNSTYSAKLALVCHKKVVITACETCHNYQYNIRIGAENNH